VFSFIPNTAETSFFGMIETVEAYLNEKKTKAILNGKRSLSAARVKEILSVRPRIEKIAIKDVKLRTFITEDSSRDDLAAHVYDVTYGVVRPEDNLVIIDDSIVRGTTLKKSILKMMDRLNPKKIVVVSSAPQIRYPDCYGIDMANLGSLIAFRAALELLRDQNKYGLVDEVYAKCKSQVKLNDNKVKNYIREIYDQFTADEISKKIAQLLSNNELGAEVEIIFQTIENLHMACPLNLGDWYFTGQYPTPGGNRVVNQAFINFYEGNQGRPY
ncbi:MAG: amidophosphoribosyltransferase, partial [Bacteroidia bacterium]|nr:amidophosphoribosyltransferase [Bacteroidia bacterium]